MKYLWTVLTLCFLCACDNEKWSPVNNASLFYYIKINHDACQPPQQSCNNNVLLDCKTSWPVNYFEATQDCTAGGLTCTITGPTTADCE